MLEKVDWKKVARFFFFATLVLLGGGMILINYLKEAKLQEKKVYYKTKISQIRKENEDLMKEKRELQERDSEATKKQLRKEGFVKEGEKVIKFSK
jgi:cell division protein FtsB